MNLNVYLLVLLFLSFDMFLAEESPHLDYVKEPRKPEPCYCQEAERVRTNYHYLETYCQNRKQLICFCGGSSSEDTEEGDEQTNKTKDNRNKSYILSFFDVFKDLNIFETLLKGIATYAFFLFHWLLNLMCKLFYLLTRIFWFLQIICFPVLNMSFCNYSNFDNF